MTRQLFITGLARSGSTLLAQLLNVNPNVIIASDPYFHLYRSFRNAIIRHQVPYNIQQIFTPDSPIQDYYFTDERIQLLDIIQEAELQIPFDKREWDSLYELTQYRAGDEANDIVPYLSHLHGTTYKEIFDHSFETITTARQADDCQWVGSKEVWTIEFFAPLARSYPDAKFIVIMRDPRAITASNLGSRETYPDQVGQTLSYTRHWRKYLAFILHYQQLALFTNRIHIVRYEDLITKPEEETQALCDFLEIEYTPAMLDTRNYIQYSKESSGKVWQGNSSFQKSMTRIDARKADIWRDKLEPRVIQFVDFICGPDMQLMEYEPTTDRFDSELLRYMIDSDREFCSWRSDFADPQKDYGYELFRRELLTLAGQNLDSNLVKRSFLFQEVFQQIQKASNVIA